MIFLTLNGLKIAWDPAEKKLYFGEEPGGAEPDIRYLKDLQEVLYDPGEQGKAEEDPGRELYYMFRDLCLPEHRDLFRKTGIRFDITVLVPGTVGREYVKTLGHYHPFKPGTAFTYPELYEVLYGKAHYLLQKPLDINRPEEGLEEVLLVVAGPGEKVLIPSGFGHITINPGSDFLIMSNLVAADFASIYEPLRRMKGAAYCQLSPSPENEEPSFAVNPCYLSCPPVTFVCPVELLPFSLENKLPQYHAFVKEPQKFTFLTHPENFQEKFAEYLEALRQNSFSRF